MTDDVLKSLSTASEIVETQPVQSDWMYVVGGRGGGDLWGGRAKWMRFQIWLNCPSPNRRRLFTVAAPFVSQGLVDCSRYAARWAVMTRAFHRAKRSLKRPEGGLGDSGNYTPPPCQSSPGKHTAAARVCCNANTTPDFKHACMHGGGEGGRGIRLCLHVFPESTYCNKAPSSENPPPPCSLSSSGGE